jgi:hypothetical protein
MQAIVHILPGSKSVDRRTVFYRNSVTPLVGNLLRERCRTFHGGASTYGVALRL